MASAGSTGFPPTFGGTPGDLLGPESGFAQLGIGQQSTENKFPAFRGSQSGIQISLSTLEQSPIVRMVPALELRVPARHSVAILIHFRGPRIES